MTRPRRVTFISGQLGIGGQERQLYLLLRHLDRGRFDPDVVSLSAGGYWADEIRRLGIPVLEIPRRHHWEIRRMVRLVSHLRARRPCLLYGLGYEANSYGRIAGWLAGVPRIVVGWRLTEASPVHSLLERLLAGATSRVVCNSEAVRRDVLDHYSIPPERIMVIPNGVEATDSIAADERARRRAEMGAGPGEFLVGSVTRLSEQKNPGLFVRVAARARAVRPDIRFCLVGGGPLRRPTEELARSLGLDSGLRLLGERADGRLLSACFDLFLLTSNFEGMPNAVLEAMAAGIACVTTAAPGSTEVVRDGDTGFLVPLDDVPAMAGRVLELAGDRNRLARMGTRAREHARREFSVERMVRDHESLFDALTCPPSEHGDSS